LDPCDRSVVGPSDRGIERRPTVAKKTKGKRANVKSKTANANKAAKASEKLRRETIAQTDANLARLETEDRGKRVKTNGGRMTRKAAGEKKGDPKTKRVSILDAAARVLKETGKPMRCKEVVETSLKKGYWSTNGKTPAATLYSAMLREIQTKGKDTRFRKIERGLFTISKGA
jgi:hypothetical protein